MAVPKNIDLIPEEFRLWLKDVLKARGYGDIVGVTEELNARLAQENCCITVGKSAVGNFSKMLKDQREAFEFAEVLLSDMDISQEGEMHKALLQMIATSAVHMMQSVREGDGHLTPQDLMALGRMLKDLMFSAGIREKIGADERKRIEDEERARLAANLSEAVEAGDIEADAAIRAREILGFA